jgi:hypothetical protein
METTIDDGYAKDEDKRKHGKEDETRGRKDMTDNEDSSPD